MNILLHVIAMAGLFWFATWLFERSQPVPGLVMMGVGLYFLASIIDEAINEVLPRMKRKRDRR